MAAPHVLPWWREDPSATAVAARYGPSADGDDPTEIFIVELGGSAIGMVQRYRFADNREWQEDLQGTGTPHDAAGIDYLIGEASLTGRGLGTEVVRRFALDTLDRYPEVPAVVASVDQRNRRSWRALEKAGFVRAWSGRLEARDPSDRGPMHLYVLARPLPTGEGNDLHHPPS